MKKLLSSLMIVAALVGVLAVTLSSDAFALDPSKAVQEGVTASGGGAGGDAALRSAVRTVINVLLFVIGAVAVIMIVIGGIKYTTSNGDSSQITSAKNTILYAVVGLVVAMLAYAIVNFVVSAF